MAPAVLILRWQDLWERLRADMEKPRINSVDGNCSVSATMV
jgi:hypothetical protein